MIAMSNSLDREQALGEEIANAVSHGVGFLGAAAVTPILIIKSVPSGAAAIVSASVFGASMMLLYLASTLYHAFPQSFTRTKKLFRIFDHGGIFLLIAGTYTPFTLTVLPAGWGWTLFGIVWSLAIFGVINKSISKIGSSRLSTVLYLGMGWLAVIAAKPLWDNLPGWGIFWLLTGGFMYSSGVVFFALDHRIRYAHFIWHLFVLAGTACHVVAVIGYVY
jgi:hemolysin III